MMVGNSLRKAIRTNLYKMIGKASFNQSIFRVDLSHQTDKSSINLSIGLPNTRRLKNRIKA